MSMGRPSSPSVRSARHWLELGDQGRWRDGWLGTSSSFRQSNTAEKWAEVRSALWRGFKVFFKIWIGLMVIVYFVLMIVLVLL